MYFLVRWKLTSTPPLNTKSSLFLQQCTCILLVMCQYFRWRHVEKRPSGLHSWLSRHPAIPATRPKTRTSSQGPRCRVTPDLCHTFLLHVLQVDVSTALFISGRRACGPTLVYPSPRKTFSGKYGIVLNVIRIANKWTMFYGRI